LGLASGAVAARVAELRLLFVVLSLVSLGAGYYFAYRRGRGSRFQRMALWVATPLTVFFWLLPLVTR
jgi:hypothetical protein